MISMLGFYHLCSTNNEEEIRRIWPEICQSAQAQDYAKGIFVTMFKNIDLFNYFLDHGVSPEIKNEKQDTPLLYIIKSYNKYLQKIPNSSHKMLSATTEQLQCKDTYNIFFKSLIEHNADYKNLLSNMVLNNEYEIVQFMIDNGCDINTTSGSGSTLLTQVICNKSAKMVEILIKAGAHIHAVINVKNLSVLFVSAVYGNAETTKLLLDSGAKIKDAFPTFSHAKLLVLHAHDDTFNLLIQRGLNINAYYSDGASLLHYFIEEENYKSVLKLLKLKVDTSTLPSDLFTPLMVAVLRNEEQAVKDLLDAGADKNIPIFFAKKNNCSSILDWAQKFHYHSIEKILSEYENDTSMDTTADLTDNDTSMNMTADLTDNDTVVNMNGELTDSDMEY